MRIVSCTGDRTKETIKFREYTFPDGNPEEWRGFTIFGELLPDGKLDPAALDLLGKARKIADETDDKAQLLLIGNSLVETARAYFANGADRVFVYDDPSLKDHDAERYAAVLWQFIDNYKPAALYFIQTPSGEILSSRIIDRLRTVMPFDGETTVTEEIPAAASPDPSRRGELVICEIPYVYSGWMDITS